MNKIILEQKEIKGVGTVALLLDPKSYNRYIVATGYDNTDGQWQSGSYYSELGAAHKNYFDFGANGGNPPEFDEEQRFRNIDLLNFTRQAFEHVNLLCAADYDTDRKLLHKAALAAVMDKVAYLADSYLRFQLDSQDTRFLWTITPYGSHMYPLDELYTKDSQACNMTTGYRVNETHTYGFILEVTGVAGDVPDTSSFATDEHQILGNVYTIGDYPAFIEHIKDIAVAMPQNDFGRTAFKNRERNPELENELAMTLGEEVARLWDLQDGDSYDYLYELSERTDAMRENFYNEQAETAS
ncbi:hypothetical protein FACS1894188_04650 [Clostridia bacterium]|nr:hypothetical protein FACS1894188_04650 [Clostridia bacterium]